MHTCGVLCADALSAHHFPGRIWCGATVEPDDVQALTAWIRWGYEVIQEERKTS